MDVEEFERPAASRAAWNAFVLSKEAGHRPTRKGDQIWTAEQDAEWVCEAISVMSSTCLAVADCPKVQDIQHLT